MIIVALLVLIVLILLFGAGAVKSAIKRIAVFAAIIAMSSAAVIGFRSSFGEDGLLYLSLAILVGVAMLVVAGLVTAEWGQRRTLAKISAEHFEAARKSERRALRRIPKIERLWFHFAEDIARFDPAAQDIARRYYDASNIEGLREFCRGEIARRGAAGDESGAIAA